MVWKDVNNVCRQYIWCRTSAIQLTVVVSNNRHEVVTLLGSWYWDKVINFNKYKQASWWKQL